jgi:alpha-1,2-rhamnosyltransferase
MKTGDVLILLDSSWYLDMWKTIDFHKRNGIRVVTVVYDLIPHSHPQFCTPALAQSFNKWITQAAQRSDAVIAISKTIASDFKRDLPKMTGSARHQPRISHFLLGSELDGAQHAGNAIGPEILRFGQSSRPTYIYVSTIEPRKNHRYALDGFDVLWERGVEANLVIVGRVGWQGEEFARRVRNHKHFGKRLFMHNNVEDNELAYLYEKVQGLIFTSIAEGFGLPIVEGLQKGLPVFASDIPVFREIGRQGVQFVDISNPASLADTVAAHIAQGAPRLHEPVQWLSWQQSTQQLFTSIETSLVDVWRNDVEEVALEAQSTL